jgi:hypothetical protein
MPTAMECQIATTAAHTILAKRNPANVVAEPRIPTLTWTGCPIARMLVPLILPRRKAGRADAMSLIQMLTTTECWIAKMDALPILQRLLKEYVVVEPPIPTAMRMELQIAMTIAPPIR